MVKERLSKLGGKPYFWADPNSQFKAEFRQYGVHLLSSRTPVETRTEISREYFQHGKIWLAPHLSILPFELENARWPEEASAAGKFSRVKDRDHTLDSMEHILSKRPRGHRDTPRKGDGSWLSSWAPDAKKRVAFNPHLGVN